MAGSSTTCVVDVADPVLAASPDTDRRRTGSSPRPCRLAPTTDSLLLVVASPRRTCTGRAAPRAPPGYSTMTKALSSMSARPAVVDLVEVVDVLGAGRHHARRALADDAGSSGRRSGSVFSTSVPPVLALEAVPVADLGEEREAVLADRHHAGRPTAPLSTRRTSSAIARHVAVLQPDPGDRLGRAGGGERRSASGSPRPWCTTASRPARAARWRGRRATMSMCVWSGVATTTASQQAAARAARGGRSTRRPDGPPPPPHWRAMSDRYRRRRSRRRRAPR